MRLKTSFLIPLLCVAALCTAAAPTAGKRYKESQQDNGGIRESLNGELPGNYPFSARAVIDRYAAHDMPLGWLLPNDG